MSQDFSKKLSKRSSMWESTQNLSNYTRPQGAAIIDPGKHIQDVNEDQLDQAIQEVLAKEYAGLSLDPSDSDRLTKYVTEMAAQGYGLSYNKLNRIIGLWLTHDFKPTQTEYDEGYQSLSWG